MKRCGKCDQRKPCEAFSRDKGRKDGLNGYCKECRKNLRKKEWNKTFASRSKEYRHSPQGWYSQKKGNAKARDIAFSLSFEEFLSLKMSPCEYCGIGPKEAVEKYGRSSGIDRRDNDRGYITENCVPCCQRCNTSKGAKVLGEQWIPPKERNNESL